MRAKGNQVPSGTKEIWWGERPREPEKSAVPAGTFELGEIKPSAEALGYFQPTGRGDFFSTIIFVGAKSKL